MKPTIADLAAGTQVDTSDFPMETMTVAAQVITDFLRESGLEDNPLVKEMQEGQTAAQAMGLTRDDLEVLYAAAFNQLNAGDFAKAEDLFTYLCMIDPLEAKNHYCLGMARQMGGKLAEAAPIYINFLALDATNPHGYLRYGECMMAKGERTEALDAFRLALAEAEKDNRDPAAAAEARSKLALADKDA